MATVGLVVPSSTFSKPLHLASGTGCLFLCAVSKCGLQHCRALSKTRIRVVPGAPGLVGRCRFQARSTLLVSLSGSWGGTFLVDATS